MILATAAGDREVRLFDPNYIPSWPAFSGYQVSSGIQLSNQGAMALPTVGAAIRLISETIGGLPLDVYQGEQADKERMPETDQWHLLHEEPNPDQSAFDLLCDVASSIEGFGNAYIRKLKVKRKIVSLTMFDPVTVQVRRDEGNQKVFEIWHPDGRETLTSAQVLHIRGFTQRGGDVGLSPIAQHRESLGSAIALQQFQGTFYRNQARPDMYVSVPGEINEDQAQRIKDRWMEQHGGANQGGVAVVGNGASVTPLTVPLKDAQFIETQEYGAELAARIFLGPAASLLGSDANIKTEEESLRFVNFCLLPRLKRISSAFNADFDLFPDGTDLYSQFFLDEFLRADAATRAEVMHKQIQVGVLLPDEARAEEGRPPLPDGVGQIPQVTPVGGAPNPAMSPDTPDTTPPS